MSVSISTANLYCIHSNHLFSHPLCEEQPTWKRVANIAFHIFTLGIPLAIYHVVSYVRSIAVSLSRENEAIQAIGINSVQQNKHVKPYSALGQEALAFAKKQLQDHPEIVPSQFSAGGIGSSRTHQPNLEIARLTTLYRDIALNNFENLLKKHQENPWANQEVIDAADMCMKIGYAISNLTLDDLKSFTETLSSKGINRTYAEALTYQDSYQYRTFYFCTDVYHWLRGAIAWSAHPQYEDLWWEGLFFPTFIVPPAHASLFYQSGTIQNTWNRLYNDYCDRVRLYVNEQELSAKDTRHDNWTKKDTGVKSFTSVPDTQPT